MAPRRHVDEWAPHRETIQRLYVDENKRASDVMTVLAGQGFKVTDKQFKGIVRKWKMTKHYKNREKNAMLLFQERRELEQGKATAFRKHKQIVPNHTLRRFKKDRENSGVGLNPDQTSMSGVSFCTPSQNGENNIWTHIGHSAPAHPLPPTPTEQVLFHIGASFGALGPSQPSLPGLTGHQSQLHAAIEGGTGTAAELLSEGARVETMDQNDDMALHLAAVRGDVNTVYHLLNNYALVDVLNRTQKSPLYNAVVSPGGWQVVVALLEHGADPNLKLEDGDTVLHTAVSLGDHDMVSLLLSKNADITSRNNSNETPLGLAVSRGYLPIVELLIQHRPWQSAYVAQQDRLLSRAVEMDDSAMADLMRECEGWGFPMTNI